MKIYKVILILISISSFIILPNLCYCIPNEKEIDEKFNYLIESADEGDARSQYSLCIYYDINGDRDKQLKYCNMSASQNYPPALHYLGAMYMSGKVVQQDYKKARELLEKASELGNAEAYGRLAIIYMEGYGVNKNYYKALKYAHIGAKNKDSLSNLVLGNLYMGGMGVEQNIILGKMYIYESAKQGRSEAMAVLGGIYEHGIGTRYDYKKAKEWYGKACDRGNQRSCENYKRLGLEGY